MLTNETHRGYKGGQHDLRRVRNLAVDYVNERIYAVDNPNAADSNKYRIVRLDYADTAATVVFQGAETDNCISLDVFDDLIVWQSYAQINRTTYHTVYTCKLNPICKRESITVLYTTQQVSS